MTSFSFRSALAPTLLLAIGFGGGSVSCAQITNPPSVVFSPGEIAASAKDEAQHTGDAPDVAPPIATDLSPDLKPDAVLKAMRKVADWQLERAEPYFNQAWTYGALYGGMLAASRATGDAKYHDAMMGMGEKFQWRMRGRLPGPDNECIAQTYLDLYQQHHDAKMLEPTQAALDLLVVVPDDPAKINWWWCDALYMAPAVWVRAYRATGDKKYLDYMNREWWICSDKLYDKEEHLYSRDASFLQRKEKNGKKMFWSRGNGWVMGGLARILPYIPADYPDRPRYVAQFKEMAARVAALQGSDGLWRAGLLDQDAYTLPENSGSAFFAYALAWGINEGILDRATYQPVVARAWKGLLGHVYADGRLGCIQQTGAAPAHYKPTASYVYGVGAFLLAGSEISKIAQNRS